MDISGLFPWIAGRPMSVQDERYKVTMNNNSFRVKICTRSGYM